MLVGNNKRVRAIDVYHELAEAVLAKDPGHPLVAELKGYLEAMR